MSGRYSIDPVISALLHHVSPASILEAVEGYRAAFVPSNRRWWPTKVAAVDLIGQARKRGFYTLKRSR